MATLGVMFGGSWAAIRGGSKAPQSTPPINAGSKDEEKFIQEFLQSVEQEDKKAKIEGKQPH
ncbi:hypothetical protein OHC33_001720 [Knufia fluminis]|uniref:Uncharacterized protein n=1 Tax=Knufia fluminis TaxID=191047 RepID=A0AAN8I6V8_9EURO|nr:hypothetical protein OHC33_001720 [Knufia fluminis]